MLPLRCSCPHAAKVHTYITINDRIKNKRIINNVISILKISSNNYKNENENKNNKVLNNSVKDTCRYEQVDRVGKIMKNFPKVKKKIANKINIVLNKYLFLLSVHNLKDHCGILSMHL